MTKEWILFLDKITEAKESLAFKKGEECFFRGHLDSKWPLLPSLLRHTRDRRLSDEALRGIENDLFFEFQARAKELHDKKLSDWEILFFMRHHAVITRLLDWTEVFGVSLYFALQNYRGDTQPCIWLLNPYALNEEHESWEMRDLISPIYLGDDSEQEWDYSDFITDDDDPKFGWEYPVAIYPIQRSARLHAQRGYFTIHGDDNRPLEEIVPHHVRKVAIPTSIIPEARKFLELAGISDYLLFPDLDGLMRDLHRKYEIW